MCAWSHFLSVSGDALRRNPEMLLCITISFQANCHSAWTWPWTQLFFCHSLVPSSRAPINTTGPVEPPDSSLCRLQFLNLLIRCYCGVTPSAISSLPPRPHQSTWWSACNSGKAVLNGIRWPLPWRTGSVINHSAFWNTTVCWCRLEVQTCVCVYRPLASKHSLLAADPTYGVLLWALFRKPVWIFDFGSTLALWMCPQVSDGSDRKAHLATQGFQVGNGMLLTFAFFHHQCLPPAYETTDECTQIFAFVPHS